MFEFSDVSVGTTLRLAHSDGCRFHIWRIAFEIGIRKIIIIHTVIADRGTQCRLVGGHANEQRECENADDQRLLEIGFGHKF